MYSQVFPSMWHMVLPKVCAIALHARDHSHVYGSRRAVPGGMFAVMRVARILVVLGILSPQQCYARVKAREKQYARITRSYPFVVPPIKGVAHYPRFAVLTQPERRYICTNTPLALPRPATPRRAWPRPAALTTTCAKLPLPKITC